MKFPPKTVLLGATCYLAAGVSSTDSSSSSGTEHKVNVAKNGLAFDPPHLSAKKGDTIAFIFFQDGHTLTQTHFDNPCAGYNPPSDSFCTISSGTSKNDSSNYPTTGASDYPTSGVQPPPSQDTPPPTPSGGSGYPTPSDTSKETAPPPSPTKDPSVLYPTNPSLPAAPTPTTPTPTCLCPAPAPPPATTATTSSSYPTGPDPTTNSPAEKTCDAQCIEVSGQCQVSSDCDAQSKSPSDTKCKMEDGKCKRCGESSKKMMKKKRALEDYSLGSFRRRFLVRRDDPGSTSEDTPVVQKVDTSTQTDSNAQLNTAPTEDPISTPSLAGQDNTLTDTTPAGATPPGLNSDTTTSDSSKTDANSSAKANGLDSGFVKVNEEQKSTGKTWKIQITDDSKPLWFMCATIHHCGKGMVFAINAPDSGDKTFDKFLKTAKASTCPTQYPTQSNLQGDGCTASVAPCEGTKKETPPPSPTETSSTPPPASSGEPSVPPATPPQQNQTTPTPPSVSSGEGKDPPSTPPPNPAGTPQSNSTATTPDGKTSGQDHLHSLFLPTSFYFAILLGSSLVLSTGALIY